MLLQILDVNFSTPAATTLAVVLTDNSSVALDLTGNAPNKVWFTLEKDNNGTPVAVTIDSAALGTDPTKGEVTLTFNSTTASISVGDVLVLSSSSTMPTPAPYGVILNTATIDTGLSTITEAGLDQYTKVPTTNKTADVSYNLILNALDDNGTQITPVVIPLATPITVAGQTIGSIKLTPITVSTSFTGNEQYQFTTQFYSSADGTGIPLEFDAAASDILSLSFKPV